MKSKKLNEKRAYLEVLEDTLNFVERMYNNTKDDASYYESGNDTENQYYLYDVEKLKALEKLYEAIDKLV